LTKKDLSLTTSAINKNSLTTISAFALCLSLMASSAIAAPKKAEIVVDADTGRVLYEDMANEKRHPASITKVMTLYLLFEAIENGQISLDDRVVFSKYASIQSPTKLGIRAGDSIDVETAILSLVINSSNDTAVAISEKLGGTEKDFTVKMNAKALEIGMTNTNFANASGLPNPNNISTAEDLAKLAIAIRRDFPRQYHWFARETFSYNGRLYRNHNHLVGKVAGVDGLKTGLTRASGYNLAATTTRNGHHIVTVVLGGNTWKARDERVEQLIETAYNQIGVGKTQMAYQDAYEEQYYNSRDNNETQSQITENNFGKSQSANVQLNVNFAQLENTKKAYALPLEMQFDGAQNLNDNEEDEEVTRVETTNNLKLATNQQSIKVDFGKTNLSVQEPIEKITPPPAPQEVIQTANLPEFTIPEVNGAPKENSIQLAENQTEIYAITTSQASAVKVNFEDLPADLKKIIADEEAQKAEQKHLAEEKIHLAKIEHQKQLALKKAKEIEAKKLADAKAKQERALAAKEEDERQLALLNKRGNVVVQVGAFKEKDDAQFALTKFAKNFPSFAKKEVSSTKTDSGTWFRVRFSGMAIGAANKACGIVTRNGGVCQIISK